MKNADKGARLGNFIVDSIIFSILFSIHATILFILAPEFFEKDSIVVSLYVWLMYFLYHFFFEYITGTTPGKYFTGTIVVDYYGNKPKLINLIIRSFCRLTFFDILSYIFGLVGLHDFMSKTKVVHKQANG